MAWQTIPGTGDLLQKSGDVHRAGVIEVGTLTGFNPGSLMTLSSPIDVSSHRITSVPEPTLNHHAANKLYVDDIATGKDLSNLPSRIESGATGDLTIDISSDSIIEIEPEADINANFVGLSASPTQRTIAYLTLIDTKSHTISFTVDSKRSGWKWLSNSVVAEPKSFDISELVKTNVKTNDIMNNPSGLVFNEFGNFMLLVERNSADLKRFFLPTKFSTKNASLTDTRNFSSDFGKPSDLGVSGRFTLIYCSDQTSKKIVHFTVDSSFNISSSDAQFEISSKVDVSSFGEPVGITGQEPNQPGNVFLLNNSDEVFDMPTDVQGFVVSPASASGSISLPDQNTKGLRVDFNKKNLFVTTSKEVIQYRLTTQNCLTSFEFKQEFDASSDINNFIRGIGASHTGHKFYLADDDNQIIEYINKSPKFVKLIQKGDNALYAYED